MDNEVESFWEDRATSAVQSGTVAVTDADLLDDWLTVRNLPKFFYSVVGRDSGLEYMAIRRIRCLGQTKHHQRNGGDAYIGVFEEVIWAGSKYNSRCDDGKRYSYSKKSCDLTIEAAIVRFEGFRRDSIERLQDSNKRLKESIAELQKGIEVQENDISRAHAFDIKKTIGT